MIGLAIAGIGSATCPVTECDYSDPQFKANNQKWGNCLNEYTNRVVGMLKGMAAVYPRFGIAFRAYSAEIDRLSSQVPFDDTAASDAHRRFEDRILRTAEPDALQEYNSLVLWKEQHPPQCGAAPEPPRQNR